MKKILLKIGDLCTLLNIPGTSSLVLATIILLVTLIDWAEYLSSQI